MAARWTISGPVSDYPARLARRIPGWRESFASGRGVGTREAKRLLVLADARIDFREARI
jgi:hypothetical protein